MLSLRNEKYEETVYFHHGATGGVVAAGSALFGTGE
jgi:hypothetical protein